MGNNNKEIDIKGAAELLGVTYGSLYRRFRELFGFVIHTGYTLGVELVAGCCKDVVPTLTVYIQSENKAGAGGRNVKSDGLGRIQLGL